MITDKEELLKVMNHLDFEIADVSYENGFELVGKKRQDGEIIWWHMEREGSGFERLFKGAIKRACK